MKDEFESL
jgi:hypothetical protein